MMKRLPDSFRQTVLYGVSIVLMKSVSLLMLPFIAHHLSPYAFGQLEVISSLAVIGSILVGMGLEDSLYRFVGAECNARRRQQLAGEIFCLALITGILVCVIGLIVADSLVLLIPGEPGRYELKLVLSMLALEGVIAIPLGWLRMNNRAISFFTVTTGRALIQALLVVVLLSLGRGVKGVLEAGLIAAVIQALILTFIQVKDTGFNFNKKTGSQSLVYSLPIMLSGIVAFALNGADRWILASYTTLGDVAQFGVAAKFALAVVLLLQPFGMWWSPRRFVVLHGSEGCLNVVRYASLGIALTLIFTVFISLASPLLIRWLLPDNYALAGQYVIGLAIAMAFKELSELINLGCFTGKTTHAQLLINIVGAVTGIVSMFLLTPMYAVWGVIFGLVLGQGVRLLLFFIISQYFLPLPYPGRAIMIMTMVSIGWLSLGFLLLPTIPQTLLVIAGTGSLLISAILLKLIPIPDMSREKADLPWG